MDEEWIKQQQRLDALNAAISKCDIYSADMPIQSNEPDTETDDESIKPLHDSANSISESVDTKSAAQSNGADGDIEPLQRLNSPTAAQLYPLRTKLGRIRIVVLHRGTIMERICCTLEDVPLDDNTQYEALSYCWGSQSDLTDISLNGHQFYVTRNLSDALRELRLETEDRRLWIDAISINQTDNLERNEQVRQMHTVYATASRVLAWIGPNNIGFGNVVLLASFEELEGFDYILETFDDETWQIAFTAIRNCTLVEYWRRVWVIQEITHAKQVQIICGRHTISYATLVRLLEKMDTMLRTIPDFTRAQSMAFRSTRLFLGWRPGAMQRLTSEEGFDMFWLFRILNFKLCKDPRDKIFGIHSLLPTDFQRQIVIDYAASTAEVYAHATRKLVEKDGNLEIIAWRSEPGTQATRNNPSWCVDFNAPAYMEPFAILAPSSNAHGGSKAFFAFSDRYLETRGLVLGTIEHTKAIIWARDAVGDHRFTGYLDGAKDVMEEFLGISLVNKTTFALTCLGGHELIPEEECSFSFAAFTEDYMRGQHQEISDKQDRETGQQLRELQDRALFLFRLKDFKPG